MPPPKSPHRSGLARCGIRGAAGGGAIAALTSDHTAFNLPYGASKGALDRIVTAAARELGPQGISANVLNPGPVDTGWMDRALREELARRHPGGRLGTPADVAGPPMFAIPVRTSRQCSRSTLP